MDRILTIITIVFVFLYACNSKKQQDTKIIFHIKWANNKKFFLHLVPFKDESSFVVDSATAKGDFDSLVFVIPGTNERLLKITAPEVNMNIMFVSDAPVIDIYANYGNIDLYSFGGSSASTSLKQFIARQDSIAGAGKKISLQIDSAKTTKGSPAQIDSLNHSFTINLSYFFNQYKNFEDTIHSPAAFMAIYNNVDFGNDYEGLKKFISKAANRFPGFQPIQRLKTEALDMLKIYEEEYNIGDTLPPITLPDQNGFQFSTASLKGKYYLIDFWSTWCPQCLVYNNPKKNVKETFSADSIEVVSVAIDAEKDTWKKMIEADHLNWPQLIDEKMWQGTAVKTLKFDSIPFNFLVSPQGKIIAKAIRPDSLVSVISKNIKKK